MNSSAFRRWSINLSNRPTVVYSDALKTSLWLLWSWAVFWGLFLHWRCQIVCKQLPTTCWAVASASGDCLLSKAELVVLVVRHTFYFEGEVPLLLGGLLDKLANACQLTALGLRGWNAWEHLSKKSWSYNSRKSWWIKIMQLMHVKL